MRRDVVNGTNHNIKLSSVNSNNRYNILTVVKIKGGGIHLDRFEILEECTDSSLFLQFARIILEKGILSRGDICVVDNYKIHIEGGNINI